MQFDPKSDPADPPPQVEVVRRRNRLAGLWAAELLGLISQAAHDYARELAGGAGHPPDDEHVVGRLARDLKGVVTPHEIREKLSHLWREARRRHPHE